MSDRGPFWMGLFPANTLRGRVLAVLVEGGPRLALARGVRLLARKCVQPFQRLRWSVGDPARFIAPRGSALPHSPKPAVICLPVINWDFRFQRPQQLLTQFALDEHSVIYLRANLSGFGSPAAAVRRISPMIHETALPGDATLALYRDELRGVSLEWANRALDAVLDGNHVSEALCLVHHPFWLPVALRLRELRGFRIVFDVLDDLASFQLAHPSVARREQELARKCDLVVASSQPLFERLRQLNPNCMLLPNAADFAHFAHLPPRAAGPLAALPRPVIGYYGAISEWFDVAAIDAAASAHPEWSIVLIGSTWGADLRRLRRHSNVRLLGEQPYADLPNFLAGFDVCTIPFLNSPLTQATSPVKLYEYLSAGKPIVTTALPEMESLGELIRTYTSPASFLAQLEAAVVEDAPDLRAGRRELARHNTWRERYEALRPAISRLHTVK